MKTLRTISRLLVGAVFVFSGFVKGIDPMGSTFKFIDYFNAFGIESFEPMALPMGILLSTLEFILGIALIANFKMRITSWITVVFMGFFTILTFYLALTNPVTDCGCFGDAIKMSNWETFYKNVILMVFVVILFISRNKFHNPLTITYQYGIMGVFLLLMLGITYYCYNHLPIIDFRPYHVGANIPEKMEIPEDAPQPEYKTILKYKKDGQIKEFSIDSLPDSTWEWVSTENILIEEGYKPPIHDFSIIDENGSDITDIILSQSQPVFLLISYDLEKASVSPADKINRLAEFALDKHQYGFIGLTASLDHAINQYKMKTQAPYTFYNTDEITLKTIIRSNPGLMLIKNGTILGKWHYNDIPSPDEVKAEYDNER